MIADPHINCRRDRFRDPHINSRFQKIHKRTRSSFPSLWHSYHGNGCSLCIHRAKCIFIKLLHFLCGKGHCRTWKMALYNLCVAIITEKRCLITRYAPGGLDNSALLDHLTQRRASLQLVAPPGVLVSYGVEHAVLSF